MIECVNLKMKKQNNRVPSFQKLVTMYVSTTYSAPVDPHSAEVQVRNSPPRGTVWTEIKRRTGLARPPRWALPPSREPAEQEVTADTAAL